MNVFAFWIGDQSKIRIFKDSLERQGLNLTIGPSKEEHDFLYKNIKYYKQSFDRRIWSFCSDVWRVYILSKNEGIYIDVEDGIGPEFHKYFDDFKEYDGVFVRESSHSLASCFLYSTKKSFHIFQKSFELYKKYNEGYFVRTFPLSPEVITFVNNKRFIPGFSNYISEDNIAFLSPSMIRNKKRYFKKGRSSWSTKSYDASQYWADVQANFEIYKKDAEKITQRIYNYKELPNVFFWGIRDEYDTATTKEELNKIKQIYKNANMKPFFVERLIWSKFYRFFKSKL